MTVQSNAHNDLTDERVTPAQADDDMALALERIGAHGRGRDLAHNPMYDGRNPHVPHSFIDPATGHKVTESLSGALVDEGYQNGERTDAVRITRDSSVEYTAWTVTVVKAPGVGVTGLTGSPIPLLGEDKARGYTRISNVGTDNVLLGTLPMVNSGQGFTLAPGQAFEPQTAGPIYAVQAAAGASATGTQVSIWAERHP